MSELPSGVAGTEAAAIEPAAEAQPSPGPLTTGQRLRAAREARKMSLADVADVLRFSVRQIEALEADRYAELRGATLVRGFVRGYAKLLKLDPEPLLEDIAATVPQDTVDVRPPQTLGAAEDVPSIERPSVQAISRGGWGIAAALALGVALIVYLVLSSDVELPSVAAYKASQDSPAVAQAAPAEPPPAQAAGASGTTDPAVAPTPASDVASAATGTAVPALLVEFDDRSWLEVRDAANKVVLVGEFPKGARQAVDGKAPFQLWIGKASVVRVTFRDQRIDLKPHTREEVARLTVE